MAVPNEGTNQLPNDGNTRYFWGYYDPSDGFFYAPRIPRTVVLYAKTLTNANTEYSQALPANTLRFAFKCRTSYDIRWAFVTGKVATPTDPYETLPAGSSADSGPVQFPSGTLYLASSQAGVVVEIECWS